MTPEGSSRQAPGFALWCREESGFCVFPTEHLQGSRPFNIRDVQELAMELLQELKLQPLKT
ncbi:hypothetical protein CIK84_10225 [Glutamicibacter arilaitensis]|uniref:Uncharacterized protein n=1 Tax=Glutamicibacter arilaitensis TaxID=256701 RepID=A0A2N7S6X4_9MICC|nr:hypothetical protein CIK84_10225 [Glutamicibacter arilaitensis]